MTASTSTPSRPGGWKAVFACTPEALSLYRISLGALLLVELVLRFRFLHPFYSDQGILPLRFLWPKVDTLYKAFCIHCWSGELLYQQVLLGTQVIVALLFTLGWHSNLMAAISWFLYLSLTLRNTWLNFILDRYFHYLLWYAIFLPTNHFWSISSNKRNAGTVVSLATIAIKLQVLWLYLDAGGGKLMDPLGGWTWNADIPALDSYARHTLGARYLYALLRPLGLRLLTPIVVYVELLAIPTAMMASYLGSSSLVYTAIGLIWALHIGIAATLRNTVLLSLVACSVCCVFLPTGWTRAFALDDDSNQRKSRHKLGWFSNLALLSMVGGCLWLELFSDSCDQSVKYIWSTLLHNRWNVFVGSEEYVTWEIAPGRLADGSIVDVWGRTDSVDWRLPGSGAPCTSTARPGRWRSFPYLAGIEGEEGNVLWGYLCDEWNRENAIDKHPGRELLEFNFFMLQADVLPNMAFSPTRKRLIQSFQCVESGNGGENETTFESEDSKEASNDSGASDEL